MTLNRNVALALVSTVGRPDYDHPVICESPTKEYPPESEAHLWRPATDEEYSAYVAWWDAWYAENDPANAGEGPS